MPKYFLMLELFIVTDFLFFSTIWTAAFLTNLPIFLSKLLTPDSLVYLSIISFIAFSEILTCFSLSPCSFNCFLIKYFSAMFFFSTSVYPEISITSILSKSGPGMVDVVFAVVINITFSKLKGASI